MTSSITPTSAPVVTIKNGQAFANSRDVAATFARPHKDVLQAVQTLECSAEFTRLNFQLSSYKDKSGRLLPSYDMTKDGFTFFAMGFTGSIAAQFKELYIAAFNELEAKANATKIVRTRSSRPEKSKVWRVFWEEVMENPWPGEGRFLLLFR